jgi:hypothetical protein
MRRFAKPALAVFGLIIAVIVGVAIGSAGSTTSPAKPAAIRIKTVTTPGPTVTITPPAKPRPTVTVTQTIRAKPKRVSPHASMSGDGVFVVGSDIEPGTYHTSGAVDGAGGNCYVALLGSTDTNDIIDNANVTGPDTITVGSSVKAVQIQGCNTWSRIG